MRCKRNCHVTLTCHVIGIAAAIGVACFLTKTKKGKKITRRARRIAGEVEDLVKDELGR